MEKTKFHLDAQKKETIVFQSQMLHYGLYTPDPGREMWRHIPWHWHDEFEFGYTAEGSILYKTNRHEFLLNKGDGIFINSGTPHYLQAMEPVSEVRLSTQFFDQSFLAGYSGSIYDIRYLAPVKELRALDAVPLYRNNTDHACFLDRLCRCEELALKKEPFFELRIRSIFSELWETVYSWAMEAKDCGSRHDYEEDERIKKMLTFIGARYGERITAADLAREIHISERECYRIFRNTLGTTPGNLILSVRLQKAQELLWYTDKSILEIAVETGFGTSSYFCKMFKAYHHTTPRAYRMLKAQQENRLQFS